MRARRKQRLRHSYTKSLDNADLKHIAHATGSAHMGCQAVPIYSKMLLNTSFAGLNEKSGGFGGRGGAVQPLICKSNLHAKSLERVHMF